MAAGALHPGLVALLNANATAAGLAFDVPLANNTRLLVGRPPTFQAQNPHNAPPPAPFTAPPYPNCNDKPHHLNPPGTNPCLSAANPLGVLPAAGFVFPVEAGNDLRNCAIAGPLHGAGFQVCRHCLHDIRNQPWSQMIFNDVAAPAGDLPPVAVVPQPLTAPAGAPVWKRFLTHLCLSCERQELLLLRDRADGPAVPLPDVTRTRRGYTEADQWPYVTCICLERWHEHTDQTNGPEEVCIRHRHRRSCERHDEQLIMRNQNDKWLRETKKDVNNPQGIIRLHLNRPGHIRIMAARRNKGYYRACRCGAEPKTRSPALVWMCLGCEGVVHATPPPAPGLPFTLPAVGRHGWPCMTTRRTTRMLSNGFQLRRARG